MDRELMEILGDFERSSPEVRGFLQVEAESYADVAGVRVRRKVTTRRAMKISLPADGCHEGKVIDGPEDLPADGFASVIHVNPVALGTHVEALREPVPAAREEDE